MTIKEKIAATVLVSKLASKFKNNTEIKKKINNFEDNIEKELCPKCKRIFPLFKYKLQATIRGGRVFCKPCNKLISQRWAELFAEATKKTK